MGAGRWRQQPESTPRRLVVIHDSEQAEDLNQTDDADQLVSALSRPGIAGYHAVTDIAPAGYHQIAPWHARVNGAPPLNADALHVCIPERVAYTRDEWIRCGHIEVVAAFLRDAHDTFGIPLVRLTPEVMRPHLVSGRYYGPGGYCEHVDVTKTWGQTTHTDLGKNFPRDVLDAMFTAVPGPHPGPTPILNEEVEDDMETPCVWQAKDPRTGAFSDFVLYLGGGRCQRFASVKAKDETARFFPPVEVNLGTIREIAQRGTVGVIQENLNAQIPGPWPPTS